MFSKNSILPLALLLCVVMFSNCKKDSNTPPGDTPSQAEYYFSGKLDGQNLLYEIDATGNIEMVNTNSSSNNPPNDCAYTYGCNIGPVSPNGTPAIDVSFPDLFTGVCADVDDEFSGLFKIGHYDYGMSSGDVLIKYWDDDAEVWNSSPGLQTNAVFEITASERRETPFGVYQKVTGTASCLLFNAAGESIKLENAKFVLSFGLF